MQRKIPDPATIHHAPQMPIIVLMALNVKRTHRARLFVICQLVRAVVLAVKVIGCVLNLQIVFWLMITLNYVW